MISVEAALARLFALVTPPEAETVPLREAAGRVLAAPVRAARANPPFDASAMDGYAVRHADVEPGAILRVVGEAAAGHGAGRPLGKGEAMRIFTGAPLPAGADRVVIQENVSRQGERIVIGPDPGEGHNVRPAGQDFPAGFTLEPPRRLSPADIALLAAMNVAQVPVARRPSVALIATGDELVMPGEVPGPDQIVCSNTFGLAALLRAEGALPRMLPIARDELASLGQAFELAEGADLVVTVGGASVGDHDLVAEAGAARGLERTFYKIAMRPGKPLMAGRLGRAAMIGLPGNPVSAMVCGHVFLAPVVRAMQGLPARPARRARAPLAGPVPANGPREHYMRARLTGEGLAVDPRQDSALLTVLAEADALVVRPPGDPARPAGHVVDYLPLSTG